MSVLGGWVVAGDEPGGFGDLIDRWGAKQTASIQGKKKPRARRPRPHKPHSHNTYFRLTSLSTSSE
jgi:hypothetical protein